ncbi:hypothetical protein CBL_01737 [Carabus blaptoides fortunei]
MPRGYAYQHWSQEDVKINCYKAFKVNASSMAPIIDGNFGDVKFQQKKRLILVDPSLIFQRVTISKKTEQHYFHLELAPYQLLLFDKIGMCNTNKSSFFTPVVHSIDDASNVMVTVEFLRKHREQNLQEKIDQTFRRSCEYLVAEEKV